MAPMDDARTVIGAEPLNDEAKRAIGGHVNGIDGSLCFPVQHSGAKPQQQDDIEDDLQFPGGPAKTIQPRDQQSHTAAGQNAIDTGTQQCEDHTGRKNVEYLFTGTLKKLCAQPIRQRHHKHAAEQAHVAEAFWIKARLQKGEKLYRQHTVYGMQHGTQQR